MKEPKTSKEIKSVVVEALELLGSVKNYDKLPPKDRTTIQIAMANLRLAVAGLERLR